MAASADLHGRDGLVVVGLLPAPGPVAVDLARRQILLALELELGPRRAGLGGGQLGLGLIDGGGLRGGLPAQPVDGGLLHGDLVAGVLHREAVVAVIDARDRRRRPQPAALSSTATSEM